MRSYSLSVCDLGRGGVCIHLEAGSQEVLEEVPSSKISFMFSGHSPVWRSSTESELYCLWSAAVLQCCSEIKCSRAWKPDPAFVKTCSVHICLSFSWTLSCTHAKQAWARTPMPKICGHVDWHLELNSLTKTNDLQHTCIHTHKARQRVLRSHTPALSDKFWQQHFTKPQSRVGVGEETEIWLFTQHKTSSQVESIITYTQHGNQWAIDQWSNTNSYALDDSVTWQALSTMPQLSSQG